MAEPSAACCVVELRSRSEFGTTRASGFDATHHFCFAGYQRPDRIDWGKLRAVNEYRLEPGTVRKPEFHSGFEILTLVEEGWLRRLGTHESRRVIHPGSAELISCGAGIDIGAEPAGGESVSYVEIWIRSAAPSGQSRRQWRPAMPEGMDLPIAAGRPSPAGSLVMAADASVARAAIDVGRRVDRMVEPGERVYLAVRRGAISANGEAAAAGDAVAASGPGLLSVIASAKSELIWIRVDGPDPPRVGS
jgi:hypothetical protein